MLKIKKKKKIKRKRGRNRDRKIIVLRISPFSFLSHDKMQKITSIKYLNPKYK